jgi:single-stranded DNA-binding protein
MMVETIISALATVICAALGALVTVETRRRKRQYEKGEARAEVRAEESRLSMAMMSASIELGEATAMAVANQKINGEMDQARQSAKKARADYNVFLERVTAKTISK